MHSLLPVVSRLATLASFLVLAATPAPVGAEPPETPGPVLDAAPFDTPYVYQAAGRGREMSVTVQYEAGYGSRETRNLGQEGVEQGLRLRFQPLSQLGIEAFGGLVLDRRTGGLRSGAASVDIIGRPLEQARHYVNLDLGVGYLYDYRGDHIPRVRLGLSRSFGALDLGLAGVLEIPVGSAGRDEVDVMTSIAVSYGFLSWLRAGLEVAAEDLEGLVETEEAEGGAKFLFGPTFTFSLPWDFFVKLNTAAVAAYVGNQRVPAGGSRADAWGFMGRAVVGWTWH